MDYNKHKENSFSRNIILGALPQIEIADSINHSQTNLENFLEEENKKQNDSQDRRAGNL